MHGYLTEYVLKGIYLGLVLFVALQAGEGKEANWPILGWMVLCTLGGLVLFLGVAAWRKLREGFRVTGRLPAFVLFLLLESPSLVYSGILVGAALGALVVRKSESGNGLTGAFFGGAGLGFLFWLLRHVQKKEFRMGLGFALAAALVAGGVAWIQLQPDFPQERGPRNVFGSLLLLGIPFFYLLTFTGMAEESEVEIAASCAVLGLGLWELTKDYFQYQSFCLIIPLVLYFWYSTRVLPGLRVFKHVVRAIGFANVGRYRPALTSFRRALQLDPRSDLARGHLMALHRSMDLDQLRQDPETLALVDIDFCLERAIALLMTPPDANKRKEADHLLEMVLSRRPAMRPVVSYWQAVSRMHAREFDEAAASLASVLDPSGHAPDDPYRASILLTAWQLALVHHTEMNRRVGTPQLAMPGRRIEAIAVIERHLTANPEDADAWTLKRILYSDLKEADYLQALRTADPERSLESATFDFDRKGLDDFDHAYVEQLGLALIGEPARWQRGAEFLRMAARGLPARGPTIFQQLALAHERAGNADDVHRCHELARKAGRSVGPKNLGDDDRLAYFTIVKMLGEQARAKGDLDAAIENFNLYKEYDRSGLETLRTLAELYALKGDAMSALRVLEQALCFDSQDKDLLERKDRYYFSVTSEQLRANLEGIRHGFDVAYCLKKAKSLLDFKEADAEVLNWARHLAELAQVVQPESSAAKVLRARALRRQGEIDLSRELLEDARNNKPEKFSTNDDADAWFLACRLLGEMYLYDLDKPDLAVPCFKDYAKSSKSGADTLYKLAQCHEKLGDRVRAVNYYEHVISYESHPLAPDAREALYRLKG